MDYCGVFGVEFWIWFCVYFVDDFGFWIIFFLFVFVWFCGGGDSLVGCWCCGDCVFCYVYVCYVCIFVECGC